MGGRGVSEPTFMESLVWTLAKDFEDDRHDGFRMLESDFNEFMVIFGVEDFKAAIEERAKELGKDLEFTIEKSDKLVTVTWKPKDADGR